MHEWEAHSGGRDGERGEERQWESERREREWRGEKEREGRDRQRRGVGERRYGEAGERDMAALT